MAQDHGGDRIVTLCPLCQSRIGIQQDEINAKFGSNFRMPVVYYSLLKSVVYGQSACDAALDDLIIKARQLEEIAAQ